MAFVQFSDNGKKVVVSVFAVRNDDAFYPHQGEVGNDDPRLLAYIAASAPLPLILAPVDLANDGQSGPNEN